MKCLSRARIISHSYFLFLWCVSLICCQTFPRDRKLLVSFASSAVFAPKVKVRLLLYTRLTALGGSVVLSAFFFPPMINFSSLARTVSVRRSCYTLAWSRWQRSLLLPVYIKRQRSWACILPLICVGRPLSCLLLSFREKVNDHDLSVWRRNLCFS